MAVKTTIWILALTPPRAEDRAEWRINQGLL